MTGSPIGSLLDAPLIPDNGLRHVNFFNGRLLTAGDLRSEQMAQRQAAHQLGRTLGVGVVEGLELQVLTDGSDGRAPVVSVAGGMAINALGQAIELPVAS